MSTEGTDDGFISVSLVRWMLKQIEKETDLTEVREEGLDYIKGPKGPMMVGVKMINRFERIDTLCEEFHKRIEGEKAMIQQIVDWCFSIEREEKEGE